jgi:hypothetical protein
LRVGNRALEGLLEEYSLTDNALFLISNLPRIGQIFHDLSNREAYKLANTFSKKASSKRIGILTTSVFDLLLTVYLYEIAPFLDNRDVSYLLVEALLFQVTGEESSIASEEALLNHSTHKCRGIHKFSLASKLRNQEEGFLFGQEVARILTGGPSIVVASSTAAWSHLIRFDAKAEIRRSQR